MTLTVRSKVVKIGNSRGIRIPRALLEQVGLTDEVELRVEGDRLIVHPARRPRSDWGARFAKMSQHGDDRMIDGDVQNQWDEEEWTW
jgi:antitoxin MazE